ncbi:hypothetical protein ACQEVC_21860 [Plantactinospora sp. CA-294935]|uniref:hypothetical protein n=1 Tax=Plantactinospora sp. CA-294935 TaxID=3240012 RepID=UPI003D932B3F
MIADDTFLNSQFAAYRSERMTDVTPAGSGAVRSTVRHRRRVAVTTGAAVAVALIVGPVAGYAALSQDQTPPPPGTSTEPTAHPTSSPSVSPRASAATTAPTAPEGRVTTADLLAVQLDLPRWWGDAPCQSRGRLASRAPQEEGNWLQSADYADVDRDGAEETVAMIGCKFNQAVVQTQVAVFDRDTTGKIVTKGQVLTSRPVGWIFQVDTRPDGSIRIEVGDREPVGGRGSAVAVRQWRTYGWTGEKFAQTGGPTSFPAHPSLADLRVTATDLVYGAQAADGSRHATTTVTIRNAGPADADYVFLSLELGQNVRHEGNGWTSCLEADTNTRSSPPNLGCLLGRISAGQTRTLVLGVASSGAKLTQVSARAHVMRLDKQRDPVPDVKEADNEFHFDQR